MPLLHLRSEPSRSQSSELEPEPELRVGAEADQKCANFATLSERFVGSNLTFSTT